MSSKPSHEKSSSEEENLLPEDSFSTLRNQLNQELSNAVAQESNLYRNFVNLYGNNPSVNNLIGSTVTAKSSVNDLLDRILFFIENTNKDFLENKTELIGLEKSILEKSKEALDSAEQAKKVSADAIKTSTRAAGISAAAPLIEHFEARNRDLMFPLAMWGLLSFLFLALCMAFIVTAETILGRPNLESTASVAMFISGKVFIVSFLVGATVWCARLFKDAYDKKSFYKHKIIITKTYQAFMISAINPETRDHVLKESIKHIFSSPPPANDAPKAEIEIMQAIPEIVKGFAATNSS